MEFSAQNIANPFGTADDIALLTTVPAVADEQWTALNGDRVVRNVGTSTLIAFHPPAGVSPRGESVIVAPGGGMLVLAMEHEGFDVARHLAAQGYVAYVLKYRVLPTPPDCTAFLQACQAFYQDKMSRGFGKADAFLDTGLAVEDVLAAIDWIRGHAMPATGKLHFVGFSAGAKVGVDALAQAAVRQHLASIGLVYFSLAHPGWTATDLPPLFAAIANDDPLFAHSGFGLLQQWQDAGQSLEFHLFRDGSHGFGARQQGTTSDQWLALYVNWLRATTATAAAI
jgi:acetyl esterase/lipase